MSQVIVGSDKDKLMVTGAKRIFYPIIITARPHRQIVFMGTGNKYISRGLSLVASRSTASLCIAESAWHTLQGLTDHVPVPLLCIILYCSHNKQQIEVHLNQQQGATVTVATATTTHSRATTVTCLFMFGLKFRP